MPNFNVHTGIAFGTIYLDSIHGDVANFLWQDGVNVSEQDVEDEIRAEAEAEADSIEDEVKEGMAAEGINHSGILEQRIEAAYEAQGFQSREDFVEQRICDMLENVQIDEPTIEGETEGVSYAISWLGGAPLLWVFESPYTGRFNPCSPCVPGAGDLNSPNPHGIEAYDVPPDWRVREDD